MEGQLGLHPTSGAGGDLAGSSCKGWGGGAGGVEGGEGGGEGGSAFREFRVRV